MLCIIPIQDCKAQDVKSEIQCSFIKSADSIKTSDLYFNVLKIHNNSPKIVSGEVVFSAPEDWKIFTFPMGQITINPGDTAWVPVRISPGAGALGGISYILSGTYKTNQKQITANTYLVLPTKSKWDFSINKSSFYFTEYSPYIEIQVKLSNTGNTNELIKIHLQAGRLLMLQTSGDREYVEYIDLPAYRDSIISYKVTYQKKLSFEDKAIYENNWKESSVLVSASTEYTQKSTTAMVHRLNSFFHNERDQASSPLNLDCQVYNIMSSHEARYNLRTFGSVLFTENRDIQYSAGVQNVYFGKGKNNNFDINNQLLFAFRYSDNKSNILISHNIYGENMHPINGRGISGNYRFNKLNKISYAFSQNHYTQNFGEYLGFATSIKNVSLNAGVIHDGGAGSGYSATSVLLGTGFTAFKIHNLSFQGLGTIAGFNLNSDRDTSVFGQSYRMTYRVKTNKFDLRFNGFTSTSNYVRNSGRQLFVLDSKYLLNEKVSLMLYGNRQYYSNSSYPYNFFTPSNYSTSDFLRISASINKGKVIYQMGPNYNGTTRQYYNSITSFVTQYKTVQPGLWGAASFKLGGNKTITPNMTISKLLFDYTTEDSAVQDFSFNKQLYYQAGLNYYDNAWRVNAYYSSGSTTDLYRSVQIDKKPVLSRSIQVRPSYEKYLFNRKVKLSAYMNYTFFMPAGRENTTYNIKYDHFLNQGWTIYLSGYVYSNTRLDEELGRVNTKDINFMAGISKSFDLQQPRLEYYDFKAVFFNDLDGNLVKSENEPPVPNILVNIEKDRSDSKVQSNMAQMDLISDVNGEILYENLPKDDYKLTFTPLVNLQSLYFLNGSEQGYFSDQDRILFIPLAESYKIKGKIILLRDPNSSEGEINLDGVRISAVGKNGEAYSALTDKYGIYIINVPKTSGYTVKINNVFGERFTIDTDEIQVRFTTNKTINLDFTFVEKRREVKFNGGNEIYQFKSIENGKTP
jgi:hypothetical protein